MMNAPASEPDRSSEPTLRAVGVSFSEADTVRALRVVADEGVRAWPSIRLPFQVLVDAACGHVAAHGTSVKLSAELYLATPCVAGDATAIGILDRHYLAKIPMHVGRIVESRGVSSTDDFMQALRERLLMGTGARGPRLADYSGRGLLGAWIRVVAVRLAIEDYRRARPSADGDAMVVPCGVDADLDHLHGLHSAAFKTCLESAFATLSKDERLVLRLTYRERMTGDAIAKVLGIDRSNVTRRVVRAREVLYAATRDAMRRTSAMTDLEFHSLAKGLAAHVEITLSRVLSGSEET